MSAALAEWRGWAAELVGEVRTDDELRACIARLVAKERVQAAAVEALVARVRAMFDDTVIGEQVDSWIAIEFAFGRLVHAVGREQNKVSILEEQRRSAVEVLGGKV